MRKLLLPSPFIRKAGQLSFHFFESIWNVIKCLLSDQKRMNKAGVLNR
ncbi:MAG: hypothetical protein ACKO13_09000 [Cytophagales bacterium]